MRSPCGPSNLPLQKAMLRPRRSTRASTRTREPLCASLVKLIEKNTHRQPVLLLDDVLSELDAKRRTALFKTLDPSLQTLITTTDIQDVEKWIKAKANVFYVENGKVTFRKEEVR